MMRFRGARWPMEVASLEPATPRLAHLEPHQKRDSPLVGGNRWLSGPGTHVAGREKDPAQTGVANPGAIQRRIDSRTTEAERTEVVPLADTDAVVAKDRKSVRQVEEEVRDRVLEKIGRPGHRFSFPSRLRHDASRGAVEVLGSQIIEVGNNGAGTGAELVDRLLCVGKRRRILSREP
jgi:hypothetical protein